MLPISFHPAVKDQDVQVVFDYIAADDVEAADRVVDGISATIELIGQMPLIGQACNFGHPLLSGIRKYPAVKIPGRSSRNYIIYYRPEENRVRILYVFHAALNARQRMIEDLRQ